MEELLICSIILANVSSMVPPTDEDQKIDLLHAPFKGSTKDALDRTCYYLNAM